jgi:hypothetical protein
MATQAQKDEILFDTKQINSLKVKRNSYVKGTASYKATVRLIALAEKNLKAKRKKYRI